MSDRLLQTGRCILTTGIGRDIYKGPAAAEVTCSSTIPALSPHYSSLTREINSPKSDRLTQKHKGPY